MQLIIEKIILDLFFFLDFNNRLSFYLLPLSGFH